VGQRAAAFHSLTPSLPHSLSSSKFSPISGLFVDDNDCEWKGSAVSLQWGGGRASAVGREGSLDKSEFIANKRGGMTRGGWKGRGLVDHAVSAEGDGYTSRSASNTRAGPLIHTQQVLGFGATVKTGANSVTSRGDGVCGPADQPIETRTPRSASQTPRKLTLQEIIHSGSTDNWDDFVLKSIGFAPEVMSDAQVMTDDADYDELCWTDDADYDELCWFSAASSPRKHYHPDAESEGEGKRGREDDPIGRQNYHGVGGGGGKEGEGRGTELVRGASPLVLSLSSLSFSELSASSLQGSGEAGGGGFCSSEKGKGKGVQGMKGGGGNPGGQRAAVASTWARASEHVLQVVPI